MKVLHLADLHFSRDRVADAALSMRAALEAAREEAVDLIAIAGDIWDGPVQNTAGSHFPEFIKMISDLAAEAPVAMIYGTPTHDVDGSLEVFEALHPSHPIKILRPGIAYGLTAGEIVRMDTTRRAIECVLFGIPEPNKKWLLADESVGATRRDEADHAIQDSMRNLLLGLGGLRKQNPQIPCVALYHGQVVGAKTSTGYSAESAIAVTRDDLAAIGADYIACGDIHLPQQVGDLPGYYAGSIYPVDFGETHQTGCTIADMSQSGLEVRRVNFPHPRRVKVSIRAGDPVSVGSYSGCVLWQEVTCTKEEAAKTDTAELVQKLLAEGAAPGSRVTLNVLPTETVRAGDIVARKSLRAKVEIWGANSSIQIPAETILKKADLLESEAAASGRSFCGSRIRIDKLILRGAIGLWEVSRKDIVVLDLAAFGPGIIALAGENGTGKTTILENLHPYPQMLTRSGTLKSHFRLRDSCRDLYFRDLATGIRYRSLIQINAASASGTAEYFLYRDTGTGFEPVPGVVGRLEAYEAEIQRLFGPLSLYLRTAFVTQRPSKNSPDLAEATKGDRKALFAELAGISYLSDYASAAKARADVLDRSVQSRKALLASMEGLPAQKSSALFDLEEAKTKKRSHESALASIVEAGHRVRARLNDLSEQITDRREALATRSGIADGINRAIRERQKLLSDREAWEDAAARGHESETALLEAEMLTGLIATLEDERRTFNDSYNRDMSTYYAARDISREGTEALWREKSALTQALYPLQAELKAAQAELARPAEETCHTCGQSLPAEALQKIMAGKEALRGRIQDLHEQCTHLEGDISSIEAKAQGRKEPQRPVQRPFPREEDLGGLQKKLASLDLPAMRRLHDASLQASAMIKAIDSHIATLISAIEQYEKNLEAFDADFAQQFPTDPSSEYAQASSDYETLRADHSKTSREIGFFTSLIASLEKRIDEISMELERRDLLLISQASDMTELQD